MTDEFELEPLQRLLLWTLAVSDDGEFWKNIKTSLKAAKRDALVREGYVEKETRKDPTTKSNSLYLSLSDRGWSWCQNHLRDEIKTRSPQPAVILERFLKMLADYFAAQNQTNSLAQMILTAKNAGASLQNGKEQHEGNGSSLATTNSVEEDPSKLNQLIREACLKLGGGKRNVRVHLYDLRSAIPTDRSVLDHQLLTLEQHGELALYTLDNPQEITSADHDAAIRTHGGKERHIVYFGGNG